MTLTLFRNPWVVAFRWFIAGMTVTAVVATAYVILTGGRILILASGSMAPAIRTGDLVAVASVAPTSVRTGQVVTFPDPTRQGHLVSHRVRAVTISGGKAQFVTRGDRNDAVERWSVPADGRVGRVVGRVPRLGTLTNAARSRRGQILLVVLPALALGLTELLRLWRRPENTENHPSLVVAEHGPLPGVEQSAPAVSRLNDVEAVLVNVRPVISMIAVELDPVIPSLPNWDEILEQLADRIAGVFGVSQPVGMLNEGLYTIVTDALDVSRADHLVQQLEAVLGRPLATDDLEVTARCASTVVRPDEIDPTALRESATEFATSGLLRRQLVPA